MRHYTANHLRQEDFKFALYTTLTMLPKAFNVSLFVNDPEYTVFDRAGPRESLSLHSLTEHVGGRSAV